MEVTHDASSIRVKKETDNVGFLLSNNIGGYCSFGLDTKHSGLFFSIKKGFFKTIDDIQTSGRVISITNKMYEIERKRSNGMIERIFMPLHTNTLVYELSKYEHIDLILDIRDRNDNREWGRNYSVFLQDNKIIIRFTKKSDERDGDMNNNREYAVYLAIEGDENLHFKKNSQWIEKEYRYDKERGSANHKRYVYNCIKLLSRRLVFSFSDKKKEAIINAERVYNNLSDIKELQKKYYTIQTRHNKYTDITIAYKSALNSLHELINGDKICVGLPWMFHYSEKEELISLKALILENEFKITKRILMRHLQSIDECNDIETIGWNLLRWHDLIYYLDKNKSIDKYFSEKELVSITDKLKTAMDTIINKNPKILEFLGKSKIRSFDDINVLRRQMQWICCMYHLMYEILGEEIDKKREQFLREKIRQDLWNTSMLKTWKANSQLGPAFFIEAYIYMKILPLNLWEKYIDEILPRLWVIHGGITSLDKTNRSFCYTHTGENPKSHYQGDSWFWINNLTAIVLHRINKEKYKPYIHQLIKSSTKEILWKGLIGHHSQMSSAIALKSEGCLNYSLSNAMYIEMVHEIFR